jgi:hypothetical protein
MNEKHLHLCLLSILAGGLVSGCVMAPDGRVAFQPFVVVAPAPVVVTPAPEWPAMVPDDYTWDGYEYVGLVGDQYCYLGPGNVWLVCDPFRLNRFHGWEGGHHDWRSHDIRNDRYRRDAHGHTQPRRDGHRDQH